VQGGLGEIVDRCDAVEAAQARLVDDGDTPRRAIAELNEMNHRSSLKNLLENCLFEKILLSFFIR
jgi:hypothetical protein